MKNTHVIPAKKPSDGYILGKCIKELSDVKIGQFTKTFYLMFDEEYFQPHHIYITSNDKFSRDEYITDGIEVIKASQKLVDAQGLVTRRNWKQIILTTDQDLIKDGVQAIHDEFLEWFVKNPNCEEVEVEKNFTQCMGECGICDNTCGNWYKIIIPKEETKQENCCTPIGQIKRYVDCRGCDKKPEQENTEEHTSNTKRSDLYNEIFSIVKQIPRDNVEGDAMDAPSCSYELERLFYKWDDEQENKNLETLIKTTYEETMRGMVEWFANNKDKDQEEAESAIDHYIYPRLAEKGILFKK